jgi:hypothetical protein
MQANKIKIGSSYAVKIAGDLYALRVTKIVTTKTGPHAADHEHRISGIIANQPEGENLNNRVFTLSEILGPYEEHQELVQQKAAEKAKREAEEKHRKERIDHLVFLLFKITGLKRSSEKYNRYDNPFRASFGSVDIAMKGVEPLIAAIERLQAKQDA